MIIKAISTACHRLLLPSPLIVIIAKSIQQAEEKDQVDDTETVLQQQQAKQEQEQADQYFWSLLNKARANNHQRKRKRSTSSSNKHEEEISNTNHSINGPNNSNNRNLDVFTAASSTNLETMLPTSFGTNLGNQPSIGIRTNTAMPIIKKDPSMAKWGTTYQRYWIQTAC